MARGELGVVVEEVVGEFAAVLAVHVRDDARSALLVILRSHFGVQ